MPILGNNGAPTGSLSLTPVDMFGHFDPAALVPIWGNPVPACIVNSLFVYCTGPLAPNPAASVSFGIYNAAVGLPATWPLVVQVAGFVLPQGAAGAWRSVAPALPLPAGTYALAVISNSAGAFTGAFHSNVKFNAPAMRTFIAPGVCPNPLGGPPTNNPANWCLYADYTPVAGGAPYAPTAACNCQSHNNVR